MIIVTGATGQIGSELVPALRAKHGKENVLAVGNRRAAPELEAAGPFERVNVRDDAALGELFAKYQPVEVYHLASLLSATGEKDPGLAWDVNLLGLKRVLDLAVTHKARLFWPSSIAVFGPTTPREQTPQRTILEPTTMYGVTKLAGESLCNYYHLKHGLDVRSLRYPGLISYATEPGGGTTDYAVAIFVEALKRKSYECFVRAETVLPMMYMDDAIRGTIELMDAPPEALTVRTSYNFAGLSFSARELADVVAKRVPGFTCTFTPDERQAIADSWPQSIDDSQASTDWNWNAQYDLQKLADAMLEGLQ